MGLTREERRQKAKDNAKKGYENRGKKSGGNFSFDFPDKTEFYKIEEKNLIRILSFIVGTNSYPLIDGEVTYKKDDEVHELQYWEHAYIGAANSSFLCLEKNFGKACPICEENKRLYDDGDVDAAKQFYPKRRVAYWIEDLLDKNKVKIFTTSYSMFEKDGILEKQAELEEDKEACTPFDSVEGNIIKFKGKEKSANSFKFKEPVSFRFLPFDERLDVFDEKGNVDVDKIMDRVESMVPLDNCMVIKEYDEIKKVLFGDNINYEDDIEKKSRREKKVKEEAKKEIKCPDGGDFGDYDPECCEEKDKDGNDVCICEHKKECEEKTNE